MTPISDLLIGLVVSRAEPGDRCYVPDCRQAPGRSAMLVWGGGPAWTRPACAEHMQALIAAYRGVAPVVSEAEAADAD